MLRYLMLSTCAVVLAWPVLVGAQQSVTGMVMRIDEPASVVILQDGRMYRVAGERTVIVDERAVAIATVAPGTRVLIVDAEPVLLDGGRYVTTTRVNDPNAVAIVPSASPATIMVIATPAPRIVTDPVVEGTVASFDATTGRITLSDGRIFEAGPNTVVLVDGHPATLPSIRPGMRVTLSQVNPIVSRDGRIALMNTGFRGMNRSLVAPDAQYAGYEAERSDAAMQVQAAGN